MNEIIQNNLFTIIIFLLIIILLLMALIGFVLYRLLTQKSFPNVKKTDQQGFDESPPEQNPPLQQIRKVKKVLDTVEEKFFCQNHKETASVGSCLICENVFCENCLVEHEGMYFCKEHFKTFANYKWKHITDVRTTPDSPETSQYIWDFKRNLWKESNIPTFVLTHYKINVEDDFIESYVQLNVRDSDEISLKLKLEQFTAKH